MPTHITTNGPRLHTQLRSDGAAAVATAAVIAPPPKLSAYPR